MVPSLCSIARVALCALKCIMTGCEGGIVKQQKKARTGKLDKKKKKNTPGCFSSPQL